MPARRAQQMSTLLQEKKRLQDLARWIWIHLHGLPVQAYPPWQTRMSREIGRAEGDEDEDNLSLDATELSHALPEMVGSSKCNDDSVAFRSQLKDHAEV